MKNTVKKWIRRAYFILTLLTAFFSAICIWYFNVGVHWKRGFFGTRTLLIVGVAFCVVYLFFSKMYNAHKIGLYRLQELTFSQMLAFVIADGFLFIASFFWFHNFQKIKLTIYGIVFVIQLLLVIIYTFILNRLYAYFDEPRPIAIIYGANDYKVLIKKLKRFKNRYAIVGCLSQTASKEKLQRLIDNCVDVYFYEVDENVRSGLVAYCIRRHKDLHISVSIEDMLRNSYEISHTIDTPFYRNRKSEIMWYYPFAKRLMDVMISGLALIILSPVLLIVAIAIKVYDKGPVFYKQERLTKNGKKFKIYKFRSMIVDAEKVGGAQLSTVGDSRITPIGRFIRMVRIDEIPQLWNVLKGDMSIVGPRPERPELAKEYLKELTEFDLRLQVKAGLTGYAQVYGKYNTTPSDKLKLDLLYISQRSLLFDFKIMFYTVKILFKPESTEGV